MSQEAQPAAKRTVIKGTQLPEDELLGQRENWSGTVFKGASTRSVGGSSRPATPSSISPGQLDTLGRRAAEDPFAWGQAPALEPAGAGS